MIVKITLTLAVLAFALASKTGFAADQGGLVYLGCNFAKVLEEHSDRITIRVDELPPVSFDEPYNAPRLIASGLDTGRSHLVRVYFDGNVVESWKFSFSQLNTTKVGIWRSAGGWHADPMPLQKCEK